MVESRLFPDEQSVLRSALRMMDVSHEEMKDTLAESGTEIHLGPRTADELLQDAANA